MRRRWPVGARPRLSLQQKPDRVFGRVRLWRHSGGKAGRWTPQRRHRWIAAAENCQQPDGFHQEGLQLSSMKDAENELPRSCSPQMLDAICGAQNLRTGSSEHKPRRYGEVIEIIQAESDTVGAAGAVPPHDA